MDVSVIGSGVIDVLVKGVDRSVFDSGSMPVSSTRLSFGGDALNESIVLSRLGKKTELISNIGSDEAGRKILGFLSENAVSIDKVRILDTLTSAINIVLVDNDGERYFLTNPESNLRKLALDDIIPSLENLGDVVSFAGMFISPLLGISEMEKIFAEVKKQEKILCVDMTKRKNGETISDIKPLLKYIDFIYPNEEEIALLTGISDPVKNADILIENGVKCAVIKLGKKGCLIRTKDKLIRVPARNVKALDSTGAGDTFAAAFICALLDGMDAENCGKFACAAASFTVETLGATDGIISKEQVMKRYLEG
ncbi:MAG: carbohydrate kinase family protein [Clostridia bacterium]|nr:carbohydrate kinase family protein [Clostridia bacterium]